MTNYDDDEDDDVATVIAPRNVLPFGLQPEEPSKPLPAAGSPAIPRSAPQQPLAPLGQAAAQAHAPAGPAPQAAMTAPLPVARVEAETRAPGWVRAYLMVTTVLTVLGLLAIAALKVMHRW